VLKSVLKCMFCPLFASPFNDWMFIFIAQILTTGVGQIWVYPKRNFVRTYTDKQEWREVKLRPMPPI
jgi:hypothetical protein